MAISGVNPKCYILALFVRDDGARFLLGDDPFEFKDNQLHFQQNTMANDVVEVQGNDGYLLAGQVRRPGTQMFDGYVCNGTNSKEEVEVKRRSFLQFFRRSHFYKVIYVFPNGTAIQRKQGFLVDDPTVQELYQQYPEYHVALNFEDVNYYTYEEDDQGHEIYAKEAIVPLAGGGATGGLIWDNYGVVWEDAWSLPLSISGVQFQILNNAGARAPIDNVEVYGDTYQQTYSGKNLIDGSYDEITQTARCTAASQGNGFTITSTSSSGATYVTIPIPNITELLGKTVTLSYTATGDGINARFYYISSSGTATNGIGNGPTITLPNSLGNNYGIGITFYTDNNSSATYNDIQLELGSATSYEPYVGGIPSPNPDYPQNINVVTGEQTVTISDGVDSEAFPISLGSIELCKIGNYQDKIFNNDPNEDWYNPELEDNAWYVHKTIEKLVANGSEDWTRNGGNRQDLAVGNAVLGSASNNPVISTRYISRYSISVNNSTFLGARSSSLCVYDTVHANNTEVWKTWLSSNNTTFYYALATPTDTKITDATLVGQLNTLGTMKLFIGENNVLVGTANPNLPATLAFDYYTKFAAIGAEWEEGGTKGATIVNVDAIDNTYPVWELTGPATNPTLSVLTTNTALTYNGTITASQKLVIDMFNKTATLNGTSVIGNISGDFVYMAPGTNRLAYTAGNTDAPDSTIYWQEVVG